MNLSPREIDGEVWQKLAAHFGERLKGLRAKVESPRISDNERREHAIHIDEIKKFLSVAELPKKKGTDAD